MQNRTHIPLPNQIFPNHFNYTLQKQDTPPPNQPGTIYNTYLTLSSDASPLASASASSRSILAFPRFKKKRRTKQNRMATAAMTELVANAVWFPISVASSHVKARVGLVDPREKKERERERLTVYRGASVEGQRQGDQIWAMFLEFVQSAFEVHKQVCTAKKELGHTPNC